MINVSRVSLSLSLKEIRFIKRAIPRYSTNPRVLDDMFSAKKT